MGVKAAILIIVVVVAVIIYYRPFASLWLVKKKCTATVEGRYVYSEGYYRANRFGAGETLMVPVYEYTVDGKLYMAIFEGLMQSYNVFPPKAEIKYDPADPEVCFNNGKRGMIIKGK